MVVTSQICITLSTSFILVSVVSLFYDSKRQRGEEDKFYYLKCWLLLQIITGILSQTDYCITIFLLFKLQLPVHRDFIKKQKKDFVYKSNI